ncbi:MAG: response regulator transcription factor [Bacteroidia bacterium]|nr:response regulator transcription factor [Bacteroidia bacterium]
MKESINIYIADDHQIVIDGLMLLLKNEKSINIVGVANNGIVAYNEIIVLKPDIALLDLRMPGKEGLEIIKLLLGKTTTKFIILSMHQEKRYVVDAMNYNAYAYLLKNVGQQELLNTIYKVASGEKLFNQDLLNNQKVEKAFLSPREMDVLREIMNGLKSAEIAERLNLSLFTVNTHRKNLMKKAGVNNVSQLITWVNEKGII